MGTNGSYLKRLEGTLQGVQRGAHVAGYASNPSLDAQPIFRLRGVIENKERSPRILWVDPLEPGSTLSPLSIARRSHNLWWIQAGLGQHLAPSPRGPHEDDFSVP